MHSYSHSVYLVFEFKKHLLSQGSTHAPYFLITYEVFWIALIKFLYSIFRLFPDETRKNELIAEGNRVPTTTMVPETTTLNTTTTQKPSAKASKDAGKVEDKEDSDNGVAKMSLAINVFLALTVLALIGLIVAGVFYLKKRQKKKQAAKTKKTSVMTSTMVGSNLFRWSLSFSLIAILLLRQRQLEFEWVWNVLYLLLVPLVEHLLRNHHFRAIEFVQNAMAAIDIW